MRKQAGDTIIEVLIALAILGLIIGVGYSIATRSLNGIQVSNERSEATKLAEGQLEGLRSAITNAGDFDVLAGGSDFENPTAHIPMVVNSDMDPSYTGLLTYCFDLNGIAQRFQMGSTPLENIDDTTHPYPSDCIFNNIYHVAFDLEKQNISPALYPNSKFEYIFSVHVTWHKAGGDTGSVEKLQLYDKVVNG